MTAPRYEIHAADCPRLCVWPPKHLTSCPHHESHTCACRGSEMRAVEAKELDELVEAADAIQEVGPEEAAKMIGCLDRLDDALQPFRAEPEEK